MQKRRRFSATGFIFVLALVCAGGGALLLIQYAIAAWGDGPALQRERIGVVATVCLAIGLWQGLRRSHVWALEVVRFRQRWRKRQWLYLFGGAVGISLFGAMLGVLISIPKWWPTAADNARELTLVYVAVGAAAGFVSGFGSQFTPICRRAHG